MTNVRTNVRTNCSLNNFIPKKDNIIFIVIFEPSLDPQPGLMTLKYWLSVRDNCSGYSLTEDFTLTITLKSEPRV